MTVAASDSGGGAGIQADLKAFAASGCFGACALTGVTAQNTVAVHEVYALPPRLVVAQLEAVFADIGVDAAKTGALLTHEIVESVSAFFQAHPVPLVVDPVLAATSGASLLTAAAVHTMISRLLPLATVVTPNEREAARLAGHTGSVAELAERIVALGAASVVITGGETDPIRDHFFDGTTHVDIEQTRVSATTTHGSGCTHSATLAAELAKGTPPLAAARIAARVASEAIAHGVHVGAGAGPVDVLQSRPV